MLTLRGAPALSSFRLDKLEPKLYLIHPEIRLLHAEYVHFAQLRQPLSTAGLECLDSLLHYGRANLEDDTPDPGRLVAACLRLVVPRPGTISPWSSKATDIAHNCGLVDVERLERGVAWYFALPEALSASQLSELDALVHDRMTESVLEALAGAELLF